MSEDLNKRQAAVEKIGCRAAELTFDWLCSEFEDLPNKLAEDMSVKVTENIIWALGEGSTIDDFADAEQQVSDLRSRLQAAGERATKAESELDRMREALEPFGRLGDFIEEQCSGFADSDKLAVCYDATDGSDDAGDPYQDAFVELGTLRVVHFQKARAALSLSPDGQQKQEVMASRGSGQRGSGEQPEPTSSAAAALAREATDEPTESEYWRDRRERMESGETPYNSDYVDEFPRFGRF